MTTPLSRLEAVSRWRNTASARNAVHTGLLRGKPHEPDPAKWVALAHECMTTQPGGKHGKAITSDEGWGWCIGMAARIALDYGNVNGIGFSAYSNHGGLFRTSQLLWVPGRFPGVSLFPHNNINTPPVARTYEWAYLPPACTTDDNALLACVDGWAWSMLFSEKVGNTADAKWCRARIIEAATSVWYLYLRTGGGVQFWDSRTGLVLPGREHEPPSLSIRSTIDAGWIPLYAYAVTGDAEWLDRAKRIMGAAINMRGDCPDAVWVWWTEFKDQYRPAGAGWKGSPETIYTEQSDLGTSFDADQNGSIPRYQYSAVIPMPSAFNPRMGRTRHPENDEAALTALRNTIEKVEASDGN
jgi:hypothetical protein